MQHTLDMPIFRSDICGITFIWREVTRDEYKQLSIYFPDPYDREEELCKLCLIQPADFDFTSCLAGIPRVLADAILRESGYDVDSSKITALINENNVYMQTFEGMVDAVITEAFPSVDLHDLYTWPLEKIMRYYAIAVTRLETFHGIKFEAPEPAKQLDAHTILRGDIDDFPELRDVRH